MCFFGLNAPVPVTCDFYNRLFYVARAEGGADWHGGRQVVTGLEGWQHPRLSQHGMRLLLHI